MATAAEPEDRIARSPGRRFGRARGSVRGRGIGPHSDAVILGGRTACRRNGRGPVGPGRRRGIVAAARGIGFECFPGQPLPAPNGIQVELNSMSKVILTVDDSASIRQMVRFTLVRRRLQGNRSGGRQGRARQIARAGAPDDHRSEHAQSGRDRADSQLCAPIGAYKGMPILMLTTESQDSKKQEGRAAGATGWIVKPFATQQLLAVVKKVLG